MPWPEATPGRKGLSWLTVPEPWGQSRWGGHSAGWHGGRKRWMIMFFIYTQIPGKGCCYKTLKPTPSAILALARLYHLQVPNLPKQCRQWGPSDQKCEPLGAFLSQTTTPTVPSMRVIPYGCFSLCSLSCQKSHKSPGQKRWCTRTRQQRTLGDSSLQSCFIKQKKTSTQPGWGWGSRDDVSATKKSSAAGSLRWRLFKSN